MLKVSRSGYYTSQKRKESKRSQETKELKAEIERIYEWSKKRYGAPKIQKELETLGRKASEKRVQRLMRELRIHSIVVKKYRPYKAEKVETEGKEKLMNREFEAKAPGKKWVRDIAYIWTEKEGWTYLASVMDLYDRKVIGYRYGKEMTKELVIGALEESKKHRKVEEGAIFHSDLGSQYTSVAYEEKLKEEGLKHSYSKRGCPYDNACIESFHSLIKKEEIHCRRYRSYEEASRAIFEYIEGWYNSRRIHSSLGYRTPNEVEREYQRTA